MLANIPRELLWNSLIAISAIAVAVTVLSIVKALTNSTPSYKKTVIAALISIAVAAASWVFNMGWIRFFMTFLLIPIVHAIVFLLSNLSFAKYTGKSSVMEKLNAFFIITYLISYLLMPDAGDIGEMYFFFGLIQSDNLSNIAFFVSNIAFICHIVLFVLQIIKINKIKQSTPNE